MGKIHTTTRGPCNWRERLGDPQTHWKREASAMETAVSWEVGSRSPGGLPRPISNLFSQSEFGESWLLLAVAEHKVDLRGTGGASQCDVWALVRSEAGVVSLAVEAKAQESFGAGNETLSEWLLSGTSPGSKENRKLRRDHLLECLPLTTNGGYGNVSYQILQRCAAAVIEARRFGLRHAAFVVQSFHCPAKSFEMFALFCEAVKAPAERGQMVFTDAEGIRLGIGWAECEFATHAEMASLI